MADLEGIKRHIGTVEDLQDVVRTMKGLAAVSIRQYERAVGSLSDYYRAVELGLFVVLRQMPDAALSTWSVAGDARVGAVVFGSDQGMCGQFNEQIVAHFCRTLRDGGAGQADVLTVAVGERVAARLGDEGVAVAHRFALPSSIHVITSLVQELLLEIHSWRSKEGVDRVFLLYNRHERGGTFQPHSVRLLPLDEAWLASLKRVPWPTRMLPLHTMPATDLFTALIRQYFFVSLYRAAAESLASENAARLAAMQAAEKNIGERLDELHGDFNSKRQMTITEELLDIVGGFEALK